jgi:hypothetical protein
MRIDLFEITLQKKDRKINTIKKGNNKQERKESKRDRKLDVMENRKHEILIHDNLLHKLNRKGK